MLSRKPPSHYIIPVKIIVALLLLFFMASLFYGPNFSEVNVVSADITTGLVGHWKFEEGTGTTAADSSGNNNTGTLTNSPTWTTGQINGGINFSGGTDYIDLGQPATLKSMANVTVAAWANPAASKIQYFVNWSSGTFYRNVYYLGSTADGSLRGMVGFPNGSSPNKLECTFGSAGTVTTSTWQHFAMTWDGSTLTGYKNGVALATTCSGTGAVTNLSDTTARIGTSFNGKIDDVRVYSRSLSSSDVDEVFDFTEVIDNTDPVVDSFTIPETHTIESLVVPISSFTASDNVGVTGYLLNESAIAPLAGDAGWSGAAQTEYTFSSAGSKTLYAWAKDSTGNVSTSLSDTIVITTPTLNDYWVSPTGAADWTECHSDEPLSGTSACSLATANANLSAGDTAVLRAGTYNTHIYPANSGLNASSRITYEAYTGETPIIRNTTTTHATYYYGIALISKNYIKIDGVTVDNPAGVVTAGKDRIMDITYGSSYNEITNSILDGNGGGAINMWDGDSTDVGEQASVVHNWLHDNVIANIGYVTAECDDAGGMQLGVPGHDSDSNYNTFEDNVFYGGAHHNLETFTKYNVLRNNYFHNEGSMDDPGGCTYGPDSNGLYGNRNIQIYDGYNEDKFNLLEGNRFGHSGASPDDDGGDGMTITAAKNIIRYNTIFNSQNNGVLFKTGASSLADNNRFYNNTIYRSGRFQNTGPQWQGYNFRWYGSYARTGNVIKNNILNSGGVGSGDWLGGDASIYSINTVTNNFCSVALTGRCSANGDPLFNDTDITDPTNESLPDLSLQSSSPAINSGTHLTQANGVGSSSLTLIVDDALYFQDGSWGSSLSNIQPDWIAIGTIDNVAQISSINYSTNTLTLASTETWNDNDPIWLYKNSDDVQVLYGSAPDYGAMEFTTASDTTSPTVTAFTIPSTSSSLTVSVSSFTATDSIGVTGYKITESSTAPLSGDSGWLETAPANYTFATSGSKTLYAWAKDAAGNISSSLNDTVTITLPTYTSGSGGNSSRPTPTPSPTPTSTNSTSIAFSNIKLVFEGPTYYVIKDNKRYGVTNPGILFSYGLEFSDGIPATQAENQIPYTDNLKPGDGSLVKKPGDTTVYLIFDNSKHAFTSESAFNSLGYSFTNVLEVTAYELDVLPIGPSLADPNMAHPNGTFINQDVTIYRISENKRYGIPNMEVYNSYNQDNSFANVVEANAWDMLLPVGGVLKKRLTSL